MLFIRSNPGGRDVTSYRLGCHPALQHMGSKTGAVQGGASVRPCGCGLADLADFHQEGCYTGFWRLSKDLPKRVFLTVFQPLPVTHGAT